MMPPLQVDRWWKDLGVMNEDQDLGSCLGILYNSLAYAQQRCDITTSCLAVGVTTSVHEFHGKDLGASTSHLCPQIIAAWMSTS